MKKYDIAFFFMCLFVCFGQVWMHNIIGALGWLAMALTYVKEDNENT